MTTTNGSLPPESNADSTCRLYGNVDRAVHRYMQSKKSGGLAVGIFTEGQSHSFFYGSKESNGTTAPDEKTIFEIGSITKVFTATLLADMHLKKEVQLDDLVNRYLPAPARLPSRDGIDITLRHLATHTSGLPRLPDNLGGKNLDPANPYAHYTEEELYACLARCRLKNKPGTKSNYSNLGAGLLGHVLAKAAGIDFETLVKQRICEPLGMIDTTITLSDDQQQRLAVGHSGGQPVPNWELPTLAGAGALLSSLRDMLRFLRANIDPSSTPLKETFRLSHEIQTEYRIYRDFTFVSLLVVASFAGLFEWQSFGLPLWGRMASVLAVLAVLSHFWPMGLDTMALGWHVEKLSFDKSALWHNGATGGYASYLAFLAQTQQGVVILANSDNQPDPIGRKLLRGLEPID